MPAGIKMFETTNWLHRPFLAPAGACHSDLAPEITSGEGRPRTDPYISDSHKVYYGIFYIHRNIRHLKQNAVVSS
jgi:hypothetical protein